MNNTSSGPDIENLIRIYSDLLFRISLIKFGNSGDAEDAVQDTLIQYLKNATKKPLLE